MECPLPVRGDYGCEEFAASADDASDECIFHFYHGYGIHPEHSK